ncbi:MAG: hypothetical protein A2Z18_00670 [Armatimonadetes bacterium RBG_16_58_9]|nr:MAG: hypothetical protein A2Z18_00670 [Armatimonadetes bacterium RBG_16_58_9]
MRQIMKTTYRIVLAALVVIFLATGYVARRGVAAHEEEISTQRNRQVLAVPVGTQLASANLEAPGDVDLRPLESLLSVVTNLRQHYVEQLTPRDETNMTYDALAAMLGSLEEPNTRFIRPAQRKVISDAMNGEFHGIGASLYTRQVKDGKFTDEHLIVIALMPGGPAEKSGLKPGDDIRAINGKAVLSYDPYRRLNEIMEKKPTNIAEHNDWKKRFEAEKERVDNGMSIIDAEDLLTGEDEKKLELTVLPAAKTTEITVTVQPKSFTLEAVTSSIERGDCGYLKINCFCNQTPEAFADAMRKLSAGGPKGLVLDLRNVSGGSMESALQVAKWFAPGKTMATLLKSRGRKSAVQIPRLPSDQPWTRPVVVLVNRGTARTPEVLASALKENGVARLVGEKTYGDFVQTTLIDQIDGSAVLMTTGKYLTSRGGNYSNIGLPVDAAVARGSSGDAQLAEAVKLMNSAGSRS